MYGCLVVVTRLCGADVTEQIERLVIRELADRLAYLWRRNYTVSVELTEVERERESIMADAERLGIRDEVCNLAVAIERGEA